MGSVPHMVPGDHLLLNAETLLGWVTCSMGRFGDLFSSCQKVNVQLKVNFWHAWLNWLARWCLHVLHSWIILGFLFLGLILGFIDLGFFTLGLFLDSLFLDSSHLDSWIHCSWILPTWFWHWSSSGFWFLVSGWTSLSTLSSHSWSFSGLQRQVVCWKLAVGCHGLWHLLVSVV